jgi:tetratricopeptide (TPR) repeat protein
MFLLIPFAIFLVSIVLIIGIIARKFVYLKKLTPEIVGANEENFWAEFFPELSAEIKKINLREYQVSFLAEFEKFLRRLRLISMKIDAFTNSLIHNVRKTTAEHEEILSSRAEIKEIEEPIITPDVQKELKEEEQRLIIEIAKAPKNAKLYKEIGNIYMKTGDNPDAMEAFKKAFELDPEDTESRTKLDKVLARLYKAGEIKPRE